MVQRPAVKILGRGGGAKGEPMPELDLRELFREDMKKLNLILKGR